MVTGLFCYPDRWGHFTEVSRGGAMAKRRNQRDAAPAPGLSRNKKSSWRLAGVGPLMAGVVLACALLLTTVSEANAMGKMCLFSAVRGVVLDHGKPVEGARIERSYKWMWNNKMGSDEVVTDAAGKFSLPAIWGSSLLGSLLPHEPYVRQTILIHRGEVTYKAWMFNKGEYRENGELGGRSISLICRLESEPKRNAEGVYGICETQ